MRASLDHSNAAYVRVSRLEASLGRCQTCVFDDAFLFLCSFEKLIEFLDLDGRTSRRLTQRACLPVMPTTRVSSSSRSLNGERRNSRPFSFIRPRRSAIRENVSFTRSGSTPSRVHDAFQHDEVLPDLGGDPPQVVIAGVALNRDRNPFGHSGARDTRSMVIPQIDSEQGRHRLALPLDA